MTSQEETILKRIDALEDKAEAVLRAKREVRPRRPIIIEFCGTPKSGKSSCINSLVIFLKRNNFRVKVLTERASICPIKNKFDPNFNIWTACQALSELARIMSNESKEFDIVILDRGLFDAVCWFNWQKTRHYLDEKTFEIFREFFLAGRWTSKIDIVYALKASPETALEREYANLLTRRYGSVMNKTVLSSYNKSIDECLSRYGPDIQNAKSIETDNLDQNEVSFQVTEEILQALDGLVSERIGFFERQSLDFKSDHDLLHETNILDAQLNFAPRAEVEANDQWMQPIPVAVILSLDETKVLAGRKVRKATSEKSAERNKTLFYFGGHVRQEDKSGGLSNLEVFREALQREVKEELGIDYAPDFSDALCIVDSSHSGLPKHFAVATICKVDFDAMKIRADAKEFGDKSVRIISQSNLAQSDETTERWSQIIIQELLKWRLL